MPRRGQCASQNQIVRSRIGEIKSATGGGRGGEIAHVVRCGIERSRRCRIANAQAIGGERRALRECATCREIDRAPSASSTDSQPGAACRSNRETVRVAIIDQAAGVLHIAGEHSHVVAG